MGTFAIAPWAPDPNAAFNERHDVANQLCTQAQRVLDAAEAIYSDAVAGDFACDWSPARLEELQQDMETMVARLEALRAGEAA
jgi:hypothetical protein